ncbi:NAD+ synthase [Litorimonas taeanensis]|uniref:Glutamine-dependent NAD(+) synthetase n=1 Tax=Litorimonas taeanensis TaxID=568099 RepID=A0A420WKL8_9PROT|nr:NAD+ synthase [Litorimonas taeanensis]RKQ71509.1 NAD+ synthase [Litorimonas taeanensis]
MTKRLKIASAQLNPTVGALEANIELAKTAYERAKNDGADILVLPEQFIIGYPAEDLVLKPAAVEDCKKLAENFAGMTKNGPAVVFNLPWLEDSKLYNAALFMRDGEITDVRKKHHLPNYGVFDEARIFTRGPLPQPIEFKGVKIGLPICEDLWQEGVASHLADQGAEILISPNGSPWRRTALSERSAALGAKVFNEGLPLIYVNQVGGQDELVFDGSSFSMSAAGAIVQSLKSFVPDYDVSTWEKEAHKWVCKQAKVEQQLTGYEADWRAVCLGLGDYVNKNGFKQVILGMSGGIDSAMAATFAVDALGADRVWCVMMPTKYTSSESVEDAKACAERLGCRYDVIPIKPAIDAFNDMLEPFFKGLEPSTAEENIQSRSRALVLMALSNKFGPMLVTTGNKSEMAVGYATLYGDMCGGYNPLKDLYKTEVFALADWRNLHNPDDLLGPENPIPQRIITKPPSAELRDDQKDSDSLPEYDVLDDILRGLIDEECAVETLLERGHSTKDVSRIQHLLYIAEYKRRQAPPGVKIGTKNFGRDRRYPITNRYRDAVPTDKKL